MVGISIFFCAAVLCGTACYRMMPAGRNTAEKGILAGAAELTGTAVLANFFAVLGIFSLYALSAALVSAALLLLWLGGRKRKEDIKKNAVSRWDMAAVVILVSVFCLYFFFPIKYMPAGRDPGVYLINGVHIAKTGEIDYGSNEYLNEHYEELKKVVKLDYPGFYSEYEYGLSDEAGGLVTQFLHMFPSLLAVGYGAAGMEGLVRVNAVVGVFALGVIYLLAKQMFGEKAACLALIFMAVNPAQLWSGRITQSELFSQMILFLGIYWFYEGWEEEKQWYAVYAGLLFGISTFNRIDAYIIGAGILLTLGYCEWFGIREKYIRITSGLYLVFGAAALVYGFAFSYPYYKGHMTRGLGAILSMNLALLALILIGRGILSVCRKKYQWAEKAGESLRRFMQGKGSLILVGILGAAAGFAYFLRPVLLKNIEEPVNLYAMRQFCWYTTALAVLLMFYGIYRMLCGNKEWEKYLLFLAVGLSNLAVYIYRPSISPDHIWMSRRWIFICIPFVLMTAAYGITNIRIKNRRIGVAGQVAVTAVIAGILTYESGAFLTEKMYDGMDAQYEETASKLKEDAVYLTTETSLAGSYRCMYGKNVFLLKNTGEVLREYLRGNETYFIGNTGALDPFCIEAQKLSEDVITGTFLEKTTEYFPKAVLPEQIDASVYRLKPADKKELLLDMDVFTIADGSRRTKEGIVSSKPGYAFWGPYMNLEEGRYQVVFEIEAEAGVQGICEAAAGGRVLTQKEFTGSSRIKLTFHVWEELRGIEFRIQTNEEPVTCKSVRLLKKD